MSNYWKKRNEEKKHIQSLFKTDAEYNKAIQDIYKRAEYEITKEIESELLRYSRREELSMSEARKKVNKMDVEAFQSKAKQYVKEKNFTSQANEELRAYNVRMRMSRLELLQNNIRLELIAMADEEGKLLYSRLDQEAIAEFTRQAGILGESVPSVESLRRKAKALVEADFRGTNFSNRIWGNQRDLQRELEKVLESTLIRGQHPRVGARDLQQHVLKEFKDKRYAAERLAITESARVQTGAQKMAFEEYDIKWVEWIAESGACDICEPMDGKILAREQMDSGSVTIPAHPFADARMQV